MSEKINVLVWSEYIDAEKQPEVVEIYPEGIGKVIADFLSGESNLSVRTGGLDNMESDLSEESLLETDVLVWWDHFFQDRITDEILERIKHRIYEGMGFIALHSAIVSRVFRGLMGTSCAMKWREVGEKERVWVIDRGHRIAAGLEREYIDIPISEMYGESANIPHPEDLVFVSWYAGGEVMRSGCCYKRGNGRIFLFTPGHEEYPIYYQAEIQKIIINAVNWAKPSTGPPPNYAGHSSPLEKII